MIGVVGRQKGLAANVYHPAAEVYQQDELPPCHKVELRGGGDITPLLPYNKD